MQDSRAIIPIASALQYNITITSLNLGYNLIEKRGCNAIGVALRTNTSLTYLDLVPPLSPLSPLPHPLHRAVPLPLSPTLLLFLYTSFSLCSRFPLFIPPSPPPLLSPPNLQHLTSRYQL